MLAFDGDHGGGAGCTICPEELALDLSGQTQRYMAVAHSNGPNLDDPATRFYTDSFAWTVLPPYGEGSGRVAGEAPTISVIELWVTPLDQKGKAWDSFEDVVVSDLAAGKIVGFTIAVHDYDPPDNSWMLWSPEATSDTDLHTFFDILGYRPRFRVWTGPVCRWVACPCWWTGNCSGVGFVGAYQVRARSSRFPGGGAHAAGLYPGKPPFFRKMSPDRVTRMSPDQGTEKSPDQVTKNHPIG